MLPINMLAKILLYAFKYYVDKYPWNLFYSFIIKTGLWLQKSLRTPDPRQNYIRICVIFTNQDNSKQAKSVSQMHLRTELVKIDFFDVIAFSQFCLEMADISRCETMISESMIS